MLSAEITDDSTTIGGYSYVPGGITNQKLALFGLFLEAVESDKKIIIMPDLLVFDPNFNHKFIVPETALVRWEDHFDFENLQIFVRNYGVSFSNGPRTPGKFGWNFFRSGLEYIQHDVSGRKFRFSDLAKGFFANLIPKSRFSSRVCALKEVIFGDSQISTVVQLRIEKDWQDHVKSGQHPGAYDHFDFINILSKIKKTLSLGELFVCCDEGNLPTDKETIRKTVTERLGLKLSFKSDYISNNEFANLDKLELSFIDFEIARAAPCFVGISSSSYSCMLAYERRHLLADSSAKADYIYDVPGPDVAERDDGGIFDRPELSARSFFEGKRRDFYLARTYTALWGDVSKRIRLYQSRLDLGDRWSDEYFIASYQIASLMSSSDYTDDEISKAYEDCISIGALRAEPFYGLARFYRMKGKYSEGVEVCGRALHIPVPAIGMDVETWIYEYGLLDEYAVCAYHTGLFRESAEACVSLLSKLTLPEAYRSRIEENARLSIAKLSQI